MASEDAPIRYFVSDGVATITLNRPERMNAMTFDLMTAIQDALEDVRLNEDIRLVILTGSGRAFCAGADLISPPSRTGGDRPDRVRSRPVYDPADTTFDDTLRALMACPVPTLARINGPAAGGGFGLSLACDISIAARSAFFVATFSTELGIVPDMGATWNLPRRIGRARALGVTLLGERLPAERAAQWGLIWNCVDDDMLDQEVARVSSILMATSPAAVRRTRETIDAALRNTFSEQLALETSHQAELIPRNMPEGIRAFRQKRRPVFGGARD